MGLLCFSHKKHRLRAWQVMAAVPAPLADAVAHGANAVLPRQTSEARIRGKTQRIFDPTSQPLLWYQKIVAFFCSPLVCYQKTSSIFQLLKMSRTKKQSKQQGAKNLPRENRGRASKARGSYKRPERAVAWDVTLKPKG